MITTVLAMAVVLHALPQQRPMTEAERQRNFEYWEKCVNVKEGDDFTTALSACNELMNPAVPLDTANRGMVYAKAGVLRARLHVWGPAVQDLTTALGWVAPEFRMWVRVERGLALNELRRYEEARADLNAVLEAEPSSSEYHTRARIGRGIGYFLTRDYPRAIADFDILLATKAANAHLFYMRSLSRAMRGDAAGAKADMDAAVRLDPNIDATMKSYGVDLPVPPVSAPPSASPIVSEDLARLIYKARLAVEMTRGQPQTAQRTRDIEDGLEATASALRMDGSNVDALTYRSILLRLKASETASPTEQRALIAEADALRAKADALMKRR